MTHNKMKMCLIFYKQKVCAQLRQLCTGHRHSTAAPHHSTGHGTAQRAERAEMDIVPRPCTVRFMLMAL